MVIIKRLPVKVSYRDDILLYGVDNLYPQRVENVIQRAPVTNSAITVTADFLNGNGFEFNSDFVLGSLSVNEVLYGIRDDMATFNSFALILDVNMLGEIVEVSNIDFKYVRLGVPNKRNEITYAKVSVDWEDELPKNLKPPVLKYPLWQSKEHAQSLIESWDFESNGEFPGFLLYVTPRKNTYPLSSIDSVLDSSQTNAEIQIFELANVQNGFQGATLIKHTGKIQDDEERRRVMGIVEGMKGAENANSVHVWEVPDGFDGNVLEQFPANNQDRLFENTNKATVNRIVQSLAIPPSLLGIMPENSFFNLQEIEEAYRYYNIRTQNRRAVLERVFNKIGEAFVTPTQFGKILIQQYTI